MQTDTLFATCRNDGQDAPEVSTSVINSMFTAMRSGISAVSRRIGIPQALRNMLEGDTFTSTARKNRQTMPKFMLETCCNAAQWLRNWRPCLAVLMCNVMTQST